MGNCVVWTKLDNHKLQQSLKEICDQHFFLTMSIVAPDLMNVHFNADVMGHLSLYKQIDDSFTKLHAKWRM